MLPSENHSRAPLLSEPTTKYVQPPRVVRRVRPGRQKRRRLTLISGGAEIGAMFLRPRVRARQWVEDAGET